MTDAELDKVREAVTDEELLPWRNAVRLIVFPVRLSNYGFVMDARGKHVGQLDQILNLIPALLARVDKAEAEVKRLKRELMTARDVANSSSMARMRELRQEVTELEALLRIERKHAEDKHTW